MPHSHRTGERECNGSRDSYRKWPTSSLLFSSHWPKQIMQPHLTSKLEKHNLTMSPQGEESWDICEQHCFQPQWPSYIFTCSVLSPFSEYYPQQAAFASELKRTSEPTLGRSGCLVCSRSLPNKDEAEGLKHWSESQARSSSMSFLSQIVWFQSRNMPTEIICQFSLKITQGQSGDFLILWIVQINYLDAH